MDKKATGKKARRRNQGEKSKTRKASRSATKGTENQATAAAEGVPAPTETPAASPTSEATPAIYRVICLPQELWEAVKAVSGIRKQAARQTITTALDEELPGLVQRLNDEGLRAEAFKVHRIRASLDKNIIDRLNDARQHTGLSGILCVHDELVFVVPQKYHHAFIAEARTVMERPPAAWWKVPLRADASVGCSFAKNDLLEYQPPKGIIGHILYFLSGQWLPSFFRRIL